MPLDSAKAVMNYIAFVQYKVITYGNNHKLHVVTKKKKQKTWSGQDFRALKETWLLCVMTFDALT